MIFDIFGVAKKSENRINVKNVKKNCRGISKKGVKHHFWTTWTIPDLFFSTIKMLTRQNFHFLQKSMKKIMFLHFLKIQNYKNHDFSLVFSTKNEMGQNSKNQILHKNQTKITIFTFFATTKIQKTWFFNGFWLKMSCDTPKNHIFHLYTSKKWKKSWIFARTHFSNFEFT